MTAADDQARLVRVINNLMDEIEGTQRSVAALSRAQDTKHTTIMPGSTFDVLKEDGSKLSLGSNESGKLIEHVGGPTPAQPETPEVDLADGVLTVVVDGYDVDDNPAPADLKQTRVHYSRDETFEPYAGTFKGTISGAKGQKAFSLSAGLWYVAVQWETESGQLSQPSEIVTVDIEPPVDAQDIQDTLDEAQERIDAARDEAQPRFEALETGLQTNESNIADAQGRIEVAEQLIEPLPGQMAETKADVEAARDEAAAASAAAVEANNRSMTRLANGNFENDLLYWEYQNVTLTDVAHSGQFAATIGTPGWLRPESSMPVVPEQIWELSLYHQGFATVSFQSVVDGERTAIESFDLDGTPGQWADSGSLRVTIPNSVDMLTFTLSGTGARVDDITLRDVTDVVRLEQAANANRQKAEQAISELAVMRLAVDGEGGLKDRLTTAETTLETKADESALEQLDQKLSTNLAAIESHYSRVWRQPTPPPPGVHYAWLGEPHASVSVRLDGDGNEIARKWAARPNVATDSYLTYRLDLGEHGPQDGETVAVSLKGQLGEGKVRFRLYNSGGNLGIGFINPGDQDEYGVYHTTFAWEIGSTDNSHVNIYAQNPTTVTVSSLEWIQIERGDTSTPYFDGSTESDRAHDLWYNTDGVPHEWVNGQGWTPISDARITELANTVSAHATRLTDAETGLEEALEGPIDHDRLRVGTGAFDEAFASKLIADHATIINAAMRNLSVEEKLLFAEAIGEQIWAELGVFDRLQAREGWIGGTLLADGAVTAEKIHATRELITKIMGAEWAYVAEQLVVDGELIANHADIISAAIKNLSVTERADLFEAFITTLGAQEAVIDLLIGKEAWIGGTMLKDDTVTTRHIEFTETLVGNIAELLHLVVGRIDANAVWADSSWQREAYFGSEDADQQTRVDGSGVRLYRLIDGEFLPAAIFGGGDVDLTFFDGDQIVGSMQGDGTITGHQINAQSYTVQGRELVGDALQDSPHPILDTVTQAYVARNHRIMQSTDGANTSHYGFLPLSFPAIAGHTYNIVVPGFRLWFMTQKWLDAQILYTTDGTQPVLSSPVLFEQRAVYASNANLGHFNIPYFTAPFHAETTGTVRLLLALRAADSTSRYFQSNQHVEILVQPAGITPESTGETRDVTPSNPDLGGDTEVYWTAWQPAWVQAYLDGSQYSGPSANRVLQGNAEIAGVFTSHTGGYRTTTSIAGETGVTLNAALAGAKTTRGTLTLTGRTGSGAFHVHWHTHTTTPTTFDPDTIPPNYIGTIHITPGQEAHLNLPQAVLNAIAADTFQGFSFHPRADSHKEISAHGLEGSATNQPLLRLQYVR